MYVSSSPLPIKLGPPLLTFIHTKFKIHKEEREEKIILIFQMGRSPCCDKNNVKKGPWSSEEDVKLKAYIEKHGTGGNWIALPQKIGLKRCGKSCRLRWLNYLRPNIKHGDFTEEEDNIICRLYISIGSRYIIIAAQLPGRTDNDIKNYWNTRLKKKLLGDFSFSNPEICPGFDPEQQNMYKNLHYYNHINPQYSYADMLDQDYPASNNFKTIPSINSQSCINPVKSDIIGQMDAGFQQVPGFTHAEVYGLIDRKALIINPEVLDQHINEFDCFKDIDGSMDSISCWLNEF
ncbi:uncharacterized protein [Primulina huaijiensis]|uniref:uncharacterized protein n=1 Tax=Primulina huaijiensis TaxID=1492673 RepID=UPI003CC767B4